MGRGAARPLTEPLVESLVELLVELSQLRTELCAERQCFEVRHVDSAITYRAQVFSLANQNLAWQSLNSRTRKYRPLVPRVNKENSDAN